MKKLFLSLMLLLVAGSSVELSACKHNTDCPYGQFCNNPFPWSTGTFSCVPG